MAATPREAPASPSRLRRTAFARSALAIDGAFAGLPIASADARRLARLDAGRLVRRMIAGMLQLPDLPRQRR